MTVLIRIAQLVCALTLLITVHEFGHFLFAKIFKVRVNKFYIFFNPRFSLMRFKRIGKKVRFKFFCNNDPIPAWDEYPDATEWGIGWLPLGGYCQIAGMVDETQNASDLPETPQPWEYRAQKSWKRLLIISGGVLMNFITAIVIYWLMLFTWGTEYVPVANAYLGYDYCETALAQGFVNGDRILSVDGEPVEMPADIVEKIIIEGRTRVKLLRDGREVEIILPADFSEIVIDNGAQSFCQMRVPFVIDSVSDSSYAGLHNLFMQGDSVVGINGINTPSYSDVARVLDENKDRMIDVELYRADSLVCVTTQVSAEGKMGVIIQNPYDYFTTCKKEYNIVQAFPAGVQKGVETLVNYVKQFRLVFTAAGAKSVGGFIAIGKIFPEVWDWSLFWSMTALISVILAFMNFLPIPMLDGGYFIFIIYEMITGRKPSDKFMDIAQKIGFAFLLLLLIYANGNDIFKLFK